ncbi:hypothetical protein NDU88_000366 [Pleurodeles waltl]|uniref:Uncharacterized protein n=1 Tax=Pleurodeles waltl TaxID=8319 RepID=A0AAV7P3S4_PLEWA|nr:hypothetical protein NDU88_000366 [Pleurodeles waltl]
MLSGLLTKATSLFQGQKDGLPRRDHLHLLQHKRICDSPLLLAAKENDTRAITKLLQCRSTDVYEKGAMGETALHVAAMYGHVEAVKTLLLAAPDLVNDPMTSQEYEGQTALHIAVAQQNLDLVKELVKMGADVSSPRATGTAFQVTEEALYYYGKSTNMDIAQ